MFDFENLEVYKKGEAFNSIVNKAVLKFSPGKYPENRRPENT
jgi:hypothetical protein